MVAARVNVDAWRKAQEEYERDYATQDDQHRWEEEQRLEEAEAVEEQLNSPMGSFPPISGERSSSSKMQSSVWIAIGNATTGASGRMILSGDPPRPKSPLR